MKIDTKSIQPDFQPFTLNITIESPAELATLWMHLNIPFITIMVENPNNGSSVRDWCRQNGVDGCVVQFFDVLHEKIKEIVKKDV